jgi:hypothetical protein
LRALHERHKGPFTTRVLSDKLQSDEELRAAAPESLENFTPRALSEALRRRAGMRFAPDGLRVERAGRGREGVLWQVVVDSPTDLRELASKLLGPEVGDEDYEALERAALREA